MTIEQRIERLERTNRRYRLIFTLLGVLAACAVGISATQDDEVPDVIQAKAFEVVDEEGNKLIEIRRYHSPSGGSGGSIRMNTNSAQGLIRMRSDPSVDGATSSGTIQIWGSSENSHVLSLADNGIVVFDKQRHLKNAPLSMYVGDGSGRIFLHNKENHMLELSSTTDGGVLVVYNKTGEPVCTLRVDEHGNGVIGAWDRNGKGRTLKPGP